MCYVDDFIYYTHDFMLYKMFRPIQHATLTISSKIIAYIGLYNMQ